MTDATEPRATDPGATYLQRLLHRWLVEYNPLYLLSAALVLGGTFLCSRELTRDQSAHGPLGVTAIAELYAACLIGGAALLTRIGQRRPAVMLAMLTVLYQWDLTLHTERSPYLGAWAAVAWVLVFAAKLGGLAWAVRIRLSRDAVGAALVAAIGLAFFPVHLPHAGPREAGALVAVWIFALASLLPSARVTSLAPLDAWGSIVLQRAARAASILSALLVTGHLLFWSSQWEIPVIWILPVLPLIAVRRVRSEARAWALVAGTLLLVGKVAPGVFSSTALLAAASLALRALAPALSPERRWVQATPPPEPPYRSSASGAPPAEPEIAEVLVPVRLAPGEARRLLAGTVFALYLSVWTIGWTHGPWPAHVVALDVGLTVALLAAAWKGRARIALAPLLVSYLHLVVQAGLLPLPRSPVEWGASAVALGFALLLASLATSYRLREMDR